jgi:hypothetical protein
VTSRFASSAAARTATSAARLCAVALALVGVALAAAGCGDDGPASFVGRASNAVVYVTWTRSDDTLTGQLTQARRADENDGTVDTVRASFDGTADGSAVSLQLDQGLGAVSTLTGELDGDALALDYPGVDGDVVTIRLRKGDGSDFNTALAALRDEAGADKEAADAAAAEAQALQDAEDAAAAVRDRLAALGQAAEDATASSPALYQADLDTIRSSLDTVRSSYEELEDGVANDYGTVCDDAAVVADDVQIMREDIAVMRVDVRDSTNPGVLGDDIRELRALLAELEAVDPALVPADAPTRDQVEQAIRAARRKVRRAGARGADFAAADDLLDQAEAIKAKADAACQRAGG